MCLYEYISRILQTHSLFEMKKLSDIISTHLLDILWDTQQNIELVKELSTYVRCNSDSERVILLIFLKEIGT